MGHGAKAKAIAALEVRLGSPVRRRAALKTVQLPAAEEHQNRYVWKITPNLNGTPETL